MISPGDAVEPPSSRSRPAGPSPASSPGSRPFAIVGIGASAGGLEAFTHLLTHLPPHPGLAILFVLHLEPHHKSELVHVLGRVSPLPVQEASEGMAVEIDRVYLIPPNRNMALIDGKLALSPRSPIRGQHMPIDHLFRSLAEVQKERAIGVILSGGGTDGTLGFQAIKAEGGITFAQDEKSAGQDSMPRSAALDGSVDYVLPPAQIARELVRLARHPYTCLTEAAGPDQDQDEEININQVVELVRSGTQIDFANYKRTTLQRRIQRRMALLGVEGVTAYLERLRDDPAEVSSLYQDFLISVTQFFRDPAAFDALQEKVFPALIQDRPHAAPIRIWVAGCSTGEEVYSLVIALLEFLGHRADDYPIKVLATDLNESALEKARAGLYLDNIEIDVSPQRLRRFFVRVNKHYQISRTIRDLCVFSRHNMATDPPFSHLDLVSCRNVLIYMDAALQRRVLPVFHYALNPRGFLFLGASESIGTFTDLFEPIDAKHRLFAKKLGAATFTPQFGAFITGGGALPRAARPESAPLWSALDVQREADRVVVARYAPVGVVVDEAMTVLQFRGRTSPYLEPAPGVASLDLMRMLREGLMAEVRSAVNQAKAENGPVVREGVRLVDRGPPRTVRVEVVPLKVPPSAARFFLILFQDTPPVPELPASAAPGPGPRSAELEAQLAQMQQELSAMREYLQSVIEEQESTNEELKSANEEILSANEELQSTNEELQTAKEEAQSANEELVTVNEVLRHRNAELARVNSDLLNLLSGVGIPIVMVSRDLRVRRFTPLAEQTFNLIPTDVGRPISDIKPNLAVADFGRLIAQVIDSLTPYESEVQDQHGRWYALRVRPYVTIDGKIDGASIVLVDIDAIKRHASPPQPPPASPGPSPTE